MIKFNWLETSKWCTFLLRCVGVWPPQNDTYSCNFYSFYAYICVFVFVYVDTTCQTVMIFYLFKDIDTLITSIYMLAIKLIACFKAYKFFCGMKILKELATSLNCDTFQPKSQKQKIIVKPCLEQWKKIFAAMWASCIISLSAYMVAPLLDKTGCKLIVPAWYPFNSNSSAYYAMTYVYQAFSFNWIALVNINIDLFLSAINVYIGCQFDLLCDNLRNIKSIENPAHCIINCVRHHLQIVRFAKKYNKFWSSIILGQFLASGFVLGLSLFQLTIIPIISTEFIAVLAFEIAMLIEIFTYCWFGNQVREKSTEVLDAAFASDWTQWNQKNQKNLLCFMLNTHNPVEMSAFGLFSLSLELFVKILRTAWSFFALTYQVTN